MIELFRDLPGPLLEEFKEYCQEISVSKGKLIFNIEDKADKLHVLLSGQVNIRVRMASKPDYLTVSAINQPYQTFGWSGLVAPHHYTASAICEEDSRLLVIDGPKLMAALERFPEAGFVVMCRVAEIISGRLRSSHVALIKTL
jgi:CRP-like cAMP-binding protein